MDRKSIAVVVVCMGLIFLWQGVLVPKYFTDPPKPLPPGTNAPAATGSSAVIAPSSPALEAAATGGAIVRPAFTTNSTEELLVVTNENARYFFTSRGGGLAKVELVKFPETITRKRKDQSAATNVATLNSPTHLPVLTVLGQQGLMDDGIFTLTETSTGVRAEKTLANGLRVIKEFQPSTNYLIHATVRWENTTSKAIALPAQEWVVGTATPMGAADDGSAVGLMWYDGNKSHEALTAYFDNKTLGCFPGTPKSEYRDGASNVVWVAAHNQFFGMMAMPLTPAQQVVARTIALPRPSEGRFSFTNSPVRKGVETTLTYSATTIEAGKTLEQQVNLFIGPKEYNKLASIAGRYGNNADLAMGFGWSFFAFFAKGLLLIMNWMHNVLSLSYGWAIIALTVLLKVVFWPLTAASTRASQRMAALAPQITALKEKYKDDPAKFSAKQMEFYRENKINPVAGCLPMLVQLPVFFGFFTMLRTAIELRGASFMWATDLSQSDTIFTIPGLSFIPFLSTPEGLPLNILPLLYIASALWQTHITPMAPGMDPTQQKLMRWMPLMFVVFLYNFSSGLALYMTVNNLLTILQTWMMKRNQPPTPVVAAPVTASVLTPASKKKK
ncbi:MAG: membrane protein insertase YidC [Verrucomicrobiota bacterium]